MLRISPMNCEDGSVRLKLEGRLVGPWVELLRETCQDHQSKLGSPLFLELSAVGFACGEGLNLLHSLQQEGIRCISWPPFLKELSQNVSFAQGG